MKILEKNVKGVYVSAIGNVDKIGYRPSKVRQKAISNLLEHSNLFCYSGKSRINGYDMYTLKPLTLRRIKINQILKNQI